MAISVASCAVRTSAPRRGIASTADSDASLNSSGFGGKHSPGFETPTEGVPHLHSSQASDRGQGGCVAALRLPAAGIDQNISTL